MKRYITNAREIKMSRTNTKYTDYQDEIIKKSLFLIKKNYILLKMLYLSNIKTS